jgi:hypothetical protein
MEFTSDQIKVIEANVNSSIFLSGPAGTGKSTTAVERLNFLVSNGVPGNRILLFFPQRTLATKYFDTISSDSFQGYSPPVIATFGGIARRSIELYWPLVSEDIGFSDPKKSPTFLTLESSLYFISQLINPLINDEGYFSSVTIQRNRLFSQILDNLNKSAIHGFSPTEIGERLQSSWIGDPEQRSIFQDAQKSALLFREFCYQHNLLDYSLQVELFVNYLVNLPIVKDRFKSQFKHLIYDNVEEDVPVSHDFIQNLISDFQSSLIIHDLDAGYRIFLGASPEGGKALSSFCHEQVEYTQSFIMAPELKLFNNILGNSLEGTPFQTQELDLEINNVITINYQNYYPQMVAWVAEKISELIAGGSAPQDIVVLAPFLSDSLRFLLSTELARYDIASTSHRPSRALRDEPVTHCLLTLSALAHPEWDLLPTTHEIASALMQSLGNIDLSRAFLLAHYAFKKTGPEIKIIEFENLPSEIQERVTYLSGNRFQGLINWLNEYKSNPPQPLDHFLVRLFGEILSQSGYGFHNNYEQGQITGQLIDSVKKFRLSAGNVLGFSNNQFGAEYSSMVKSGVLANQYPKAWTLRPTGAVYLSPAYTFLLSNTPMDYQFWLDAGSRSWYERIYQPLTNPHILHRYWEVGKPWRDTEEIDLNRNTLSCLSTGLIRRCRKGLFFCLSDTDERGFEQKGLLLQTINQIMTQLRSSDQALVS